MENIEYIGIENRKHMRTTYPVAKRAIFRARGQKLEIKDISRGGLKFSHRDEIIIKGWVKGTVDLTDGTRIEGEGGKSPLLLKFLHRKSQYYKL